MGFIYIRFVSKILFLFFLFMNKLPELNIKINKKYKKVFYLNYFY